MIRTIKSLSFGILDPFHAYRLSSDAQYGRGYLVINTYVSIHTLLPNKLTTLSNFYLVC